MVFLEMCRPLVQPTTGAPVVVQPQTQKVTAIQQQAEPVAVINSVVADPVQNIAWTQFIHKIEQLSDPLLNSIFKQATFVSFDQVTKKLVISFAQEATLFTDWLKETEKIWLVLLKDIFGESVEYSAQFGQATSMANNKTVQKEQGAMQQQAQTTSHKIISPVARQKAATVNVSDKEAFKTANQLLDTFGGTIVEVQNDE